MGVAVFIVQQPAADANLSDVTLAETFMDENKFDVMFTSSLTLWCVIWRFARSYRRRQPNETHRYLE